MENGITATAAAAEAEATEMQQPAIPVELLMCPKRERREWSAGEGRWETNCQCLFARFQIPFEGNI